MSAAPDPVRALPPAPFTLARQAAEALTGGTWIGHGDQVVVHGAAIDSRRITPGCLFACLAGARADGHDHAAAAVGDGAALVLASRPLAVPVPVLVVADVVAALGALAAAFRQQHAGTRWIAVTGSSGKTTVKELIAAACAPAAAARGGVVHATRGNLNNHLGVPLSVLALPERATHAVIEMGANHQGEITALARIARPEVGVVTGIGPAHLEGFGGLDGVARGKSELFAALPADGRALFGAHGLEAQARAQGLAPDALLAIVRAAAGARRLLVVGEPGEAVRGEALDDGLVLRTAAGEARIALLGAHNLANAALAWHAACAAGVAGDQALAGLATVTATAGRLQARPAGAHLVLDDTYNANPASMAAGLAVLAARAGLRLAVLGAMGELGADRDAGHRRVGAEAARLGLPLVTVGPLARTLAAGYADAGGRDGEHHDDKSAAIAAVLRRLAAGPTTVLVKASRSSGLEVVADGVVHAAATPAASPASPASRSST